MLKRHLARSNRTATACAGLDAETVSTYLEGALDSKLGSRFEGHLAGCRECRRAVIEIQALRPVAVPALTDLATPNWPTPNWFVEWWQSLRQTSNVWRWGALAAASASFVLVAFVFVQRDRRLEEMAGRETMVRALSAAVVAPSPVDAVSPGVAGSSSMTAASIAKDAKAPVQTSGKVVAVTPALSDKAKSVSGGPPGNPVNGRLNDSLVALAPTSAVSTKSERLQVTRDASAEQGRSRSDFQQGQTARQVTSESTKKLEERPVPAPQAEAAAASPPAQAGEKDRPSSKAPTYALAPRDAAAKASKPQATPTPSTDDENFRAMTRKVRDKTFRFDRGLWIDQDYKPENRLPRLRLTRGSSEFERLLSDQPALGPFFDLGQVIVVWQGKVYEVRK